MLFMVWSRTLLGTQDLDSRDLKLFKDPNFPVVLGPDNQVDVDLTNAQVKQFFNYSNYTDESGRTDEYNVAKDKQGPLYFNPPACSIEASFVIPRQESPIIAVIGESNNLLPVVNKTVTYLEAIFAWQEENAANHWLEKRPTFAIQYFRDQNALFNYIGSEKYLNPNPGICFAFGVYQSGQASYYANLYFDDQAGLGGYPTTGIPDQLLPVTSETQTSSNTHAYNKYMNDGFSYIQNLLTVMILREKTKNEAATINFMAVPIPSDIILKSDFKYVLSGILPLFVFLMFLIPVYNTTYLLVLEKESLSRESMRMMGLSQSSYWISWFIYYTVFNTGISLVAWAILCINVIENSTPGYVFAWFWLYGESIFGQIILFQSFFRRSKYAGLISAVLYFVFMLILVAEKEPQYSPLVRALFCLIPQVDNGQIAVNFAEFESSEIGVTRNTVRDVYEGVSYSELLGLFAAGGIIFTLLGLYCDNALPSASGGRKHPCFCFMPRTYSCCRRTAYSKAEIDAQDSETPNTFKRYGEEMECRNLSPEDYESVPAEISKQDAKGQVLIIDNLEKVYENGHKAVKGLNLKIYPGQIFALLGQNGAGKTTTISMLTGLFYPTKGKSTVFGLDMATQKNEVAMLMGVCPQHDILFDFLTSEEHLDMFYTFKGGNPKLRKKEIEDLIKDVGLTPDRKKIASQLSGGNRRKLSVAIAMCADSRLIILDEPTAGMDIGARHAMWEMLKNYRRDKIIILTTHYMDEADVLGDRVGIMAQGQMRCLGSSLFLKNRFGVGYRLTMVKRSKRTNRKIQPYLIQYFGQAEMLSEISTEIIFLISKKQAQRFKDFFIKFDHDLNKLDIVSYGISITTLEDVFLQVNYQGSEQSSMRTFQRRSKITVKTPRSEQPNVNNTTMVGNSDDSSESEFNDKLEDSKILQGQASARLVRESTFGDNLRALITKRFQIYKRDKIGLVCEVFLPWIMVLCGCFLSLMKYDRPQAAVSLVPSAYPSPQRILLNENNVDPSEQEITPEQLAKGLPEDSTVFEPHFIHAFSFEDFYHKVVESRNYGPAEPYRYGAYQIYRADNLTQNYEVNCFLNLTSPDVSAYFPQFMYESVLQLATNDTQLQFSVSTVPYPPLYELEIRGQASDAFNFSFMVALALGIIPLVIIQLILKERKDDQKHLQMISGLNLTAYWVSNTVADIVKCYVPIILIIGTSYLFGLDYAGVWILFLLYPIAVVPFTYCMSFLFQNDARAQMFTLFINFLFAGVLAPLIFMFQIFPGTFAIGDRWRWYLCFVPSYPVVNGLLWSAAGYTIIPPMREAYPDSTQLEQNYWGLKNMGGDALVLVMQFFVFSLILIAIEMDVFRCCRSQSIRKIRPRDSRLKLDEDVLAEEIRVAATPTDIIRVNNFRKAYTTLLGPPSYAVERISFGLEYGECFALLGVNGAGKTTTFKSLTAAITPSDGDITIEGLDIQRDFNKARKLIGYCPQHDAIFPLMTVLEHLEFYAAIKGIPFLMKHEIIEQTIDQLCLQAYRNKLAGILSGGNKRKLSVGIATLGNPPIILLDEPSAGMDPEARRFMWQFVSQISQRDKNSAVILTTHSMEEAEALSTKMGIMVRGGIFRCLGSSQHIKEKYGTGYEVEIKIHKPSFSEKRDLARQLGFKDSINAEMNIWKGLLQCRTINDIIITQVTSEGIGSGLYFEAEHNGLNVRLINLIQYVYTQIYGIRVIEKLAQHFEQVELIEQCGDFFKFRLPRENKTTGFLLGLIEDSKDELNLAQYSVSQTSLEQIFQNFAAASHEEPKHALLFNTDGNGNLQIVNKERTMTESQKTESFVGIKGKIGESDEPAWYGARANSRSDSLASCRDLLLANQGSIN